MTTKVYIKLKEPWLVNSSQFKERFISDNLAYAEYRFFNVYGKWMKQICNDDWNYDTEFDYNGNEVELKPFLVFRSNSDALRFRLGWCEG